MITSLTYTITPGHKFEKLLIVKDRRARRIRRVSSAMASMVGADGVVIPLSTSISYEGGVVLTLLPSETLDLAPGEYTFDVVADPWSYSQTVAQGTITVDSITRITPLEGTTIMQLRVDQYTDFRRSFAWQSSDGVVMGIVDARMQVKDSVGTVVADIEYFATPPDELTIAALDPNERGYLSPLDPEVDGASFELHISNTIVIAPGVYTYDILALDTGGDWGKVVEGSLIIEASTTNPDAV